MFPFTQATLDILHLQWELAKQWSLTGCQNHPCQGAHLLQVAGTAPHFVVGNDLRDLLQDMLGTSLNHWLLHHMF